MKKIRDPRNSIAEEKLKAFSTGLVGEGAIKHALTNAFENSHQILRVLDRLAKKPLTAPLVKFWEKGVLAHGGQLRQAREIR